MKRLLGFQFILPLVLLLALGLIVGSSLVMAASAYGGSDNGKTITVSKGDTFTVRLDENPSTGYSWNLSAGNGLQVVSDRYIPNTTSPMIVGSGGVHEWTIKATGNGTYKVSGVYKRPWEPMAGNETRYTLTVIVKGAQAQGSSSTFPAFTGLTNFMQKLDAIKFKPGNMSSFQSLSNVFDHFLTLNVFGHS